MVRQLHHTAAIADQMLNDRFRAQLPKQIIRQVSAWSKTLGVRRVVGCNKLAVWPGNMHFRQLGSGVTSFWSQVEMGRAGRESRRPSGRAVTVAEKSHWETFQLRLHGFNGLTVRCYRCATGEYWRARSLLFLSPFGQDSVTRR